MRRRRLILATALATITTVVLAPTAAADDLGASQGYRKAVTAAKISNHLRAFEAHGDANGGNRVGGSAGYEASAEYVEAQLESAGYTVTSNEFEFLFNADATTPVFTQVSPASVNYVDGVDFASMTFSPNGDVTATVTAVDLGLPASGTGPGCDAADFTGFAAGTIALVRRGNCTFAQKAANAAAAGAAAVVVFNNIAPGAIAGTLGGPVAHTTPVLGTTLAIGEDLANGVVDGDTGSVARVRVDREFEDRITRNLVAERTGGEDPDNVIVVGAHLDSVPRGPGVQDNGSGSATILELARVMAQRGITPRNTVRFMWFGAEEFGLLGSEAYVAGLPQTERDRIKAMVNFDMIASPNFVRFVYDGDNSAFPVGPGAAAGPPGSAEIERLFADYFQSQGLASSQTAFSGRSDYGPFIEVGIPAGGLFTGAEGIKTAEEAAVFGGTAGVAYDPCYHLACDRFANVNQLALEQMSDAAAHVVLTLAKRDLAKEPLDTVSAAAVTAQSRSAGSGGLTIPSGDTGPHPHDHEVEAA